MKLKAQKRKSKNNFDVSDDDDNDSDWEVKSKKMKLNKSKRNKVIRPNTNKVSNIAKRSSKRKCSEFSDEDREIIFSHFWQDLDWSQRKTHVAGLAEVQSIKRPTVTPDESRRKISISYHLRNSHSRLPVCKEM